MSKILGKKFEIFDKRKDVILFLFIIILLFLANVGYEYYKFSKFSAKKFQFLEVKVEHSYLKTGKNGRIYRVLKLDAKDFSFYTTTKKDSEIKRYDRLKLGVVTENISFKEYIKKRFYMPSFKIEKVDFAPNFKDKLISSITNQHKNSKIKELYATLYLATPISKELRDDVTKWGIAHVVSISGFHLGIIFSTFFLILTPIYKLFQNRFFPYRSPYFDIAVLAFLAMIFYLFLLDFTPSFLRSLVMAFLGFLLLAKNIKILSFYTLFLTIAISIMFFPSLIFSIGFYFSCLGVFYIYLYAHHFGDSFARKFSGKKALILHILLFNIYVYLAMNIPVYHFFKTFAFSQVAVIPIGYIFIIFYPVSAFLHLFGVGHLMDEMLLNFLNYEVWISKVEIPAFYFYLMNALLLPAIKFRFLAIFLAILGLIPLFYVV